MNETTPLRLAERGRNTGRRSSRRLTPIILDSLESRFLLANFSVTYTASVPVQRTDYTASLNLPKFDPALGTLTEVDLSWAITGTEAGTVTNTAATSESFNFAEDVNLALKSGAVNLLAPDLNTSQTFTNLAPGASSSYGPYSPTASAAATFTTGPNFNLFANGPGTLNLTVVTVTSQTTLGGGGNIISDIATLAGGTATVTYQYTAEPVTVAGNVYEDKLGLGVLAPGDPPIPGTLLTLTNAQGLVVSTTTTGSNGAYAFTTTSTGGPLPAGTYKVTETQPAGFLQGTNTVGTVNGVTDGTLIPVDMIGSIVLAAGDNSINNNFGELLPVTVAGNVYFDQLGTGTLQPGDLPIPGVLLALMDSTGATVATTTTNGNGAYGFTTTTTGAPLSPGTYKITEAQPAGFLQGTNTVGTVNGVTDGVLIPVDMIGSIVLHSGDNSISNNFGELLPVTIAGNVYVDQQGTGTLQPGDAPIPGVLLALMDSTGATVATTTTNASGAYGFTTTTTGAPLPPGTYKITEAQPAGFLQGSNTVGTVNGVTDGVLIPVDMIGSIVLLSTQNSISNNFGELLPVTVAGNVYVDQLGTGTLQPGDAPIPGVLLALMDSTGATVATTTTNANGAYGFTTTTTGAPLTPGTYKITEAQPAGFLQGTNTVGTVNGVTDGVLIPVDMIGSIVLKSGQNSVGNNFGELLPTMPPMVMITNVQRFGVHHQDTLVVLTFSTPLDPASAMNLANYKLFGPIGAGKHASMIPIGSAIYDPATQTVTLRFPGKLDVHDTYELFVSGLVGSLGGVLKGNDGIPGDVFEANINRSVLAGFTDHYGTFVPIDHGKLYPAAYNAAYRAGHFSATVNPGPFAAVNRVIYQAVTAESPTKRAVVHVSKAPVPHVQATHRRK
jgi:hypothetical protein